jgi:hypothetical protein
LIPIIHRIGEQLWQQLLSFLDPKSDYVPPHWHDTITNTEKFDSMDDMTESLVRLERGLFGDLHE